ncbi:MAG: DUF507 family protein [Candidatus Tectomicrobia bacterium]|nr:DUF507 family protein [Candidatus Tectomicrobia bacterium]
MRLTPEMIARLARRISEQLVAQGVVGLTGAAQDLQALIRRVLAEELKREDDLNDEVRRVLQGHAKEIAKGGVDHQRMFQMVKSKLAQERGIVL